MTWFTGILNAFGVLKDVIKMARDLMAFIEANKKEQWFQDSAKVFRALSQPTSTKEKRLAVEGIRDLLKRL